MGPGAWARGLGPGLGPGAWARGPGLGLRGPGVRSHFGSSHFGSSRASQSVRIRILPSRSYATVALSHVVAVAAQCCPCVCRHWSSWPRHGVATVALCLPRRCSVASHGARRRLQRGVRFTCRRSTSGAPVCSGVGMARRPLHRLRRQRGAPLRLPLVVATLPSAPARQPARETNLGAMPSGRPATRRSWGIRTCS